MPLVPVKPAQLDDEVPMLAVATTHSLYYDTEAERQMNDTSYA